MKKSPLTRASAFFLQAVIVLIGVGTMAFLLWEPHVEGVNVNATFFEIYFDDPFLAYVYITSIAFFVALYEMFKVLHYAIRETIFSQEAIDALRTIQYCGGALVVCIVGAEAYIVITQSGKDDIAGGVAMGLFAMLISIIIASAATVCKRVVQSAVSRKSETT